MLAQCRYPGEALGEEQLNSAKLLAREAVSLPGARGFRVLGIGVAGWACRGGAVFHISSNSAGVRKPAWLTRALRVRSSFKVSTATARAGGDGADVFVPQHMDTGGG